jgi:hypothetical protein
MPSFPDVARGATLAAKQVQPRRERAMQAAYAPFGGARVGLLTVVLAGC